AVKEQEGVPVKFIGVGERLDDLQPFDPVAFVDALFGKR
ncbi:MAG TPA: signal recognition particle-docking protein FtsY, partial [Symbiobacteriaceae bacterium]|nr:signal recognition particle-docking protein FtsY [Symbiobacteriaceae bacterium]